MLAYWQANYAQFDSEKLSYAQQLVEEFSGNWAQEKPKWVPLSKKELNRWRWKLLGAKCGIRSAFELDNLPISLQLMLTLRPLDEPLGVVGRTMKTFPARGTSYAFNC